MKDVKKVLAVILTLSLLLSLYLPTAVSAVTTYRFTNESNYLHNMGLYAGTNIESFVPDLGKTVPKEQGVVIVLRVLGFESYVQGLNEDEISSALASLSDASGISEWARRYIAAGVLKSIVNGNPDGSFGPQTPMDAKMMAKLILASTGYTVSAIAYQSGPYLLRDYGALTLEQAQYFISKSPIIRDDLVGMIFNSLKLRFMGTNETIVGRLVSTFIVNETVALSSGAYNNDMITIATDAVAAYEAAPYSTPAQVAAGAQLKTTAEALIAKFAQFPNAGSSAVVTVRNALLDRIKAQQAKITATSTFVVIMNFGAEQPGYALRA